jgi:hypothetical protein
MRGWGIGAQFFISALDGGEWSASCHGRFVPGIHWTEGWVGPIEAVSTIHKFIILLHRCIFAVTLYNHVARGSIVG